jgi:hypothetical protein
MLENKVPWKMFVPRGNDTEENWRILHNEKFGNSIRSPDRGQYRETEEATIGWAVAGNRGIMSAY